MKRPVLQLAAFVCCVLAALPLQALEQAQNTRMPFRHVQHAIPNHYIVVLKATARETVGALSPTAEFAVDNKEK